MRGGWTKRERSRTAGFTLIEIAVVIVVLALLLAMMAGIATAMFGQQRREATRQRLVGVETAIALYVSQNKRLPCPADGRMTSVDADAGLERPVGGGACQVVIGTANSQTHGVVPWRTLGLTEADVTDGWGNRLTYRVAPELVVANAMDLTACDPGGTGILYYFSPSSPGVCNPTSQPPSGQTTIPCSASTFPDSCTPPSIYTQDKGLRIRNLDSILTLVMNPASVPSTGAAYVVISHGENGEGAYNNQGVPQASTIASGTLEAAHNACTVPFVGATSGVVPILVDDFPSYSADANHFDDFLIRPSVLAVATKSQLGPRAH